MGLSCSRSGLDEGSCLLCSQVFAQFAAQRQAHTNAHTGDRGDILGTKAHTAGVAGSVQALDGLIILFSTCWSLVVTKPPVVTSAKPRLGVVTWA